MALLVLALCLVGCHRHHRIDPSELVKLDGFHAGNKVPLIDLAGRRIIVTAGTPITFVLRNRRKLTGRYEAILVDDGTFKGRTISGQEVIVPLSSIAAAAVTYVSAEKVVGFTTAGVVGGVAVVAIIVFLVIPALFFVAFVAVNVA